MSIATLLQRQPRAARERISPFGWVAIGLSVVFAAMLAYPVVAMILRILFPETGSSAHLWATTLGGHGLGTAVRNTLALIVVVNLIAVPLGVAFAWFSERTDGHLGWVSTVLPVLPLLLPPIALSVGWLILTNPRAGFLDNGLRKLGSLAGFDASGWTFGLESFWGLVLVYVLFVVPTVYVLASAAFRNMDTSLEEAARVYGKSLLRCFFTVSLPAIKPAIGSCVVLVTIATAELYSIPAIMGTPARITVMSTYIANLVSGQYPPLLDQAVLLGALVAACLIGVWYGQRRLNARGHHATIGGMGVRGNRLPLGRFKWVARAALIGYVVLAAVLPFATLVVVALQNFWQPTIALANLSLANFAGTLSDPANQQGFRNSMLLGAGTATVVALTAGVLTIFAALRGGSIGEWLGSVTKLPATVSLLVLSVGVLLVFGGAPFELGGTLWILLIVFVLIRMTNASIVTEGAVAQVGRQLAEASAVAGASAGRTFRKIMLPLSMSGLATAWILAFAYTVGDLTASIILAGPHNPTLGYQISVIYQYGSYNNLAALAVVIALVSGIAVTLVLRFGRPRYAR